ncbi:glycosyltransferase family 2 protein [candidate division WOR-3 bacterium]|nr:glycosyltransferase family 2 protein [candidate division WOR-3 bacterium]
MRKYIRTTPGNTRNSGIVTKDFSCNIAVVIPAFNEENSIGDIIEKIRTLYGLSVCVVDDASTDETTTMAQEKGAHVIRSDKNMGKGAAIIRGMRWAADNSFKGAVLMDGDGQHLPEDVASFLDVLDRRFDCIVVGVRNFSHRNMPLPRIFSNKTTSLVCSILSNKRIRDSQCGFRYVSCGIFRRIRLKTKRFQTETEILIRSAKLNSEIREVEVTTVYGTEKSHINPFLDTLRFLKMIFMFIGET